MWGRVGRDRDQIEPSQSGTAPLILQQTAKTQTKTVKIMFLEISSLLTLRHSYKLTCQSRHMLQVITKYLFLKIRNVLRESFIGSEGLLSNPGPPCPSFLLGDLHFHDPPIPQRRSVRPPLSFCDLCFPCSWTLRRYLMVLWSPPAHGATPYSPHP